MNGWHVYGMLNNKSCDFQCISENIYDALKQAEDYGVKDISNVIKSSTEYIVKANSVSNMMNKIQNLF